MATAAAGLTAEGGVDGQSTRRTAERATRCSQSVAGAARESIASVVPITMGEAVTGGRGGRGRAPASCGGREDRKVTSCAPQTRYVHSNHPLISISRRVGSNNRMHSTLGTTTAAGHATQSPHRPPRSPRQLLQRSHLGVDPGRRRRPRGLRHGCQSGRAALGAPRVLRLRPRGCCATEGRRDAPRSRRGVHPAPLDPARAPPGDHGGAQGAGLRAGRGGEVVVDGCAALCGRSHGGAGGDGVGARASSEAGPRGRVCPAGP